MSLNAAGLKRLREELLGEGRDGQVSPYPGLRPFLDEESQYFKGRGAQIREIGQRLARESCVTVLGGSGCGKSSIIRAGVIPALRRKLLPGRRDLWRSAIFNPGVAPIDNLVKALADNLRIEQDDPGRADEKIGERVRRVLYGRDGLGGFLERFRGQLDLDPGLSTEARSHANLLIVVDQFEELFRAENKGKVQVARLIELVIDYWRRRDEYPGLYLAITLRTDDLHRCAEFIDLPDFINATSYLTRRLEEVELRDAIVAPIRPPMFRAGLIEGELRPGEFDLRPYDVRVVTELLDATEEIAYDPDHLPLLQHLLAVLWRTVLDRWQRKCDGAVTQFQPEITLDDLAAALGFAGWGALSRERSRVQRHNADGWLLRYCLEHVANQLYTSDLYGEALTPAQQRTTRIALCLMGEVDDRGSFKRRYTTREEIVRVAGLNDGNEVEPFTRRFYHDHRLIWVRADGGMDVSHEALMRNWTLLGTWLAQDREAGMAYLELGEHYQRSTSQQGNPLKWLSWLGYKAGFLGPDTLERIAPLLTRKKGRWFEVAPRFNLAWTRRYSAIVGPSSSGSGAGRKTGDPEQGRAEYQGRLDYLLKSMRRCWVVSRIPMVTLFFVATTIIATGLIYQREKERQLQQNQAELERLVGEETRLKQLLAAQKRLLAAQKQAKAEQSKSRASELWDRLGEGSYAPDLHYVENLWQVALAEDEVRSEFVRQLTRGNVRQMGFSPSPVVRAIGLRWTTEDRQAFSERFEKRLKKPVNGLSWPETIMACATAALSDRLDAANYAQAMSRFHGIVKQASGTEMEEWVRGRILACLGGDLLSVSPEVTEQAFAGIFESSRNREELRDASALAVAVWFYQADDRQLSVEQLTVVRELILRLVKDLATADAPAESWGFRKARSLVSVIAALPSQDQIQALMQILEAFGERTSTADMGLVVVIAQAFELVSRQHAETTSGAALNGLLVRAEALLQSTGEAGEQGADNQRVIARLVVPVMEVADGQRRLVRQLRQFARLPSEFECQTMPPIVSPHGEAEESAHLTGIRARLLAQALVRECPSASADAGDVLDELLAVLRQTAQQPAMPSRTFNREATARALLALGKRAQWTQAQREQALNSAKAALASTPSPEEASIWAEVISQQADALWPTKADDAEFVAEVIGALKYPTSALAAREPNADEPKSATDIFLRALIVRLGWDPDLVDPSTSGSSPRLKLRQAVLDKIESDPRFSGLDLESRPIDPRKTVMQK